MPSVYDIKPAFQRALRPITCRIARCGISANAVTLIALLLSILLGSAIAAFPESRIPLLALPAFLFIRMALNAIDGMLAREHAMKSDLGAILNELGDVLSDAALYLPLALIDGFSPHRIAAIVVLACATEVVGLVAIQIGASRRYDGPMGKSDRAFVFGALALMIGSGVPRGPWISWTEMAILVLLLRTIWNRSRKALEQGRSSTRPVAG